MTAAVVPFPSAARPPLAAVVDAQAVIAMARDVADHDLACAERDDRATPLSTATHLAEHGWDCEEIACHLNAALRHARRLLARRLA